MRERLIDVSASNWVDRGQPPGPELTIVLAYYVGQDPKAPDDRLRLHVDAIRGMVVALWHIAKCAEVRERARRLMGFGIAV